MTQPHEQTFEVVLAGLLNFAALDANVVHRQLFPLRQIIQVEAEGSDILCQLPVRR